MDFNYATDQDNAELEALNTEVLADPDNFESWEKLIRVAETQEGGLNRNSAPQAIAAVRNAYDRFLSKFPLFYGYWKKYADLEFAIAGTESAELIYERGVASVRVSVDFWTNFCTFKVDTCHDPHTTREIFERAAESIGLDYLSHPFWDKYIEFEESVNSSSTQLVFAVLERIIHIPLHQYSRYFERYQRLGATLPVTALAPAAVVQQHIAEASQEVGMRGGSQADIDTNVRTRLEQYHMDIFRRTQSETSKRWTYEQKIKRPYFHVTDLEAEEVENWRNYLDFEESEGDFARTSFLYERCVVIAARYEEFWQRYARWMYAQGDKEEECRNIYERACCIYTSIARPELRFQWAMFEESCDRWSVSAAIYEAMLAITPGALDVVVALVQLICRQQGHEAATALCHQYLANDNGYPETRGLLVAEIAKLAAKINDDPEAGRKVFRANQSKNLDNTGYWSAYLDYETDQASTHAYSVEQHARVQALHNTIRETAHLDGPMAKALSQKYMEYLRTKGGKTSAKEYMELDTEVNGSSSVLSLIKARQLVKAKADGVSYVNGGDTTMTA